MDNPNQILDHSSSLETCASSSFDVAFDGVNDSVHQSQIERENISPLKNPEDNSTEEVLLQEYSRLTVDSTDKENKSPNNLSQIIMQNEMVTAGSSQFNINEDTTTNK